MVEIEEIKKELKDKVGIYGIEFFPKDKAYSFSRDTYVIDIEEVYKKLYLPQKTHIEKQKQLSNKISQLGDKIVQLKDKIVQLQDNSDNLQKDLDRSREDMDLVRGKLTKMPKHVSLIHEHIKESPDGLTAIEVAREIKKSRSSVYRTLTWLVHHGHIFKQGSRYIDDRSRYWHPSSRDSLSSD